MKNILLIAIMILFFNCNKTKEEKVEYQNQIGDTPFDIKLDSPDFKFCDSTNVLHKRAYITYKGGRKALENELLANYNFKPNYASFSGYFIIRFAVNCNKTAGRYRIQTLDSNFKLSASPDELKNHITIIFKDLENWNRPSYRGEVYDGYSFHIIKLVNGKIQKS